MCRSASNVITMQPISPSPPTDLSQALPEMIRRPLRTIVPPWSWKAAACTATIRAVAFFVTNLRSGRGEATKAMLVEAVYAIFVGGLIGAISQHLRRAKPLWATGLLICVALPGMMTIAQFGVHHLAKTKHQSSGLFVSFCLAVLAAAYTWYAMRHGAMLGGIDETTVRHDLRSLPRISFDFVLVVPRWIGSKLKRKGESTSKSASSGDQ